MSPEADDPLDAFDYPLPHECIAQHPLPERDGGRLMTMARDSGAVAHRSVRDLGQLLRRGDLLVVNTTRVQPARLRGVRSTGGGTEALLLESLGEGRFEALVRTRGKLKVGMKFGFGLAGKQTDSEIVSLGARGRVTLQFAPDVDPYALGEMPLPPYIRRDRSDPRDAERYQTVYASEPGAVAAPTAGLHLSEPLLAALESAGVERAGVVLHVGVGTFQPVDHGDWERGCLHRERFALPPETAEAVSRTRARGGRVVAVGTTATRVLEACGRGDGSVSSGAGETDLFLRPGSPFHVVDALLTNFHLPRSSLLMLVAAFAGREPVLRAYAQAVTHGYRFYSYGDAMLVS